MLIFLALIVIFVLVLNIQNNQRSYTDILKKEIFDLTRQIQELKKELINLVSQVRATEITGQQQKEAAALQAQEALKQKIAGMEELRREREEKRKADLAKQMAEDQLKNIPINTVFVDGVIDAPGKAKQQIPIEAKPGRYEQWLKNNPDLEKFIGENLFNKIGIAVLVLGIGFFVKYAIDKDWINEYGRVVIGLCCGIILIGLAHYLRKSYRSFSSVLAGGGLAVFYFTIALAFHQYDIISQQAAFIIMIVITTFAVILAVLYDKMELAVIATIGGFLTPFLVSTGHGNYIVLFTYLIILNIGLLALSWFKKWPLINILAFFFTILTYGGWMIDTFLIRNFAPPYINALLFATAFYFIFLGMNMIYNITRQKAFKAFDFFILLLINFSYYLAGMIILANWHNGDYKGLFTIALGVINFILASYFFKTKKADQNLLYLLIGLTLTYLSLTAPVQLHGHSITLFWSAETVLLLWLFQRSQIKLFKTASVTVCLLMITSLLMDWENACTQNLYNLPVIFTDLKGIITNLVAACACIAYYILLRKEQKEAPFLQGIKNNTIAIVAIILAIAIIYITGYFGINLYFGEATTYTLPNIYHLILTNASTLILVFLILPGSYNKNTTWLQLALVSVCFIFYFASGHLIIQLRTGVLDGNYSNLHWIMHWISDIGLLLVLYFGIRNLRRNYVHMQSAIPFLGWVFSIMLVYVFSFEFMQLYITLFAKFNDVAILQHQFTKAGLTILWGGCSFVMMWLGMKHRYKPLRIISLSLFALALVKLFFFDISDIGVGGKIAAFILLGILLLVVSFMYQRLKKLIIDDSEK